MVELDVEAVPEIATDAPEYVLYGGKGGVGKTTMAAATGLASAEAGAETLVVSTDPAHSLSDTFGTDIPADPTRIRDDVPLFAVEIDPEEAMATATMVGEDVNPLDGLGDLGGLGDLLGGDDGLGHPGASMPGADEAAAVQQLMRLLDAEQYDRVVVDTAPTGHTLRLLELPETMDSMVGRMLRLRERLGDAVSGIAGLLGRGDDEAQAGMAGTEDLETLRRRIERLRALLTDPARTDFRIVMVPESLSVTESKRLRDRLNGFDIPVGTVVVNRVMEPLADVIEPDVDVLSPNVDSCAFCRRRWSVQQDALGEAQDLFQGHDVKRVPLFADAVRGDAMLRVIAACLE